MSGNQQWLRPESLPLLFLNEHLRGAKSASTAEQSVCDKLPDQKAAWQVAANINFLTWRLLINSAGLVSLESAQTEKNIQKSEFPHIQ